MNLLDTLKKARNTLAVESDIHGFDVDNLIIRLSDQIERLEKEAPYAELKAKNVKGHRCRIKLTNGQGYSSWCTCPVPLSWSKPPESYQFELIPILD